VAAPKFVGGYVEYLGPVRLARIVLPRLDPKCASRYLNRTVPYLGPVRLAPYFIYSYHILSYFLQVVEPNAQCISKLTSAQFCATEPHRMVHALYKGTFQNPSATREVSTFVRQ
jgi:hypothetical protein